MQDHTVDLVRGLVEAGHSVEVISRRHPDGLAETEHEGAVWRFVDAPTNYARLPWRHPAWLKASAAEFARLHAGNAFDLVHSESTSALGLLHRGWHKRVPVVVKYHGTYLPFVRASLRRILAGQDLVREAKAIVWATGSHFLPRGNWYAFRPCEAMVASRDQLDDTIRSDLLRRRQVHVVPNGIDADVFSPGDRQRARAELGLGPGLTFVWLGRVYPGKGVDVALRALARMSHDASLVVVGDGESRVELEALAHDLGVDPRVVFAGAHPRERMTTFLRAADALVFPTLLPEAAPLTPVQAMSCGLPVVASRIGSLPEVIDQPGTNGYLVAPSDVAELAATMDLVAADAERRARIGEAARRRVLAEYTLRRMVERTLEVYEIARSRFARERAATGSA
jgi:glycosyltransferase involved in cell wall biosynthesis